MSSSSEADADAVDAGYARISTCYACEATLRPPGDLSGMMEVVAALPGGQIVVAARSQCWVYDRSEGCVRSLTLPNARAVLGIALPDLRILAASSSGNTLDVWEGTPRSRSGQIRKLESLEGHSRTVRCAAQLPHGRYVSGSTDHTLKVWKAAGGSCLKTLTGHQDEVTNVVVLSDGFHVASASEDTRIKCWDTREGCCLQTLVHSAPVVSIVLLPENRLLSGGDNSKMHLWDLNTGSRVEMLRESCYMTCAAALPDGRVAIGTTGGELRILDVNKDCYVQRMPPAVPRTVLGVSGHSEWVDSIVVLADGRIVSAADDGTVRIWSDLQREDEKRGARALGRRVCGDVAKVIEAFL